MASSEARRGHGCFRIRVRRMMSKMLGIYGQLLRVFQTLEGGLRHCGRTSLFVWILGRGRGYAVCVKGLRNLRLGLRLGLSLALPLTKNDGGGGGVVGP